MIFLKLGTVYKIEEKRNQREQVFLGYAKEIILQLTHFLLAALLASINELGSFSPFAVGFVCASAKRYLIISSFGAACGYLFTQNSLSAFKYIAAILCAAVTVRLTAELEVLKKRRLVPSCVAFLSLFLSDMAVMLAGQISVEAFTVYLAESCVGFVTAYLFTEAYDSIKLYNINKGIEKRDMEILLFCLSLILFSVSTITIHGFSPARAVLVFLLLSLSHIYGQALLFSAVGATLVFTIGSTLDETALVYAVAMLFFGAFSHLGRYAQTLSFSVSFLIAFAFCSGTVQKAAVPAEAILSAVIFSAVPEKFFAKIKVRLLINDEPLRTSSQRQAVLNRLKTASSALGDVSYCVDAASDMIKTDRKTSEVGFYSIVKDEACTGCKKQDYCWKQNFREAKKSFDMMTELLKSNSVLNSQHLPGFVGTGCSRAARLTQSFTDNYLKYVISKNAQKKIEKIRSLTGEQFSGICSMLSEFSEEFSKGICFDEGLSGEIAAGLSEQFGMKTELLVCTRDEEGHLRLEIHLKEKTEKLNETQFRELLEEICRTRLSRPVVTSTESDIIITLCERTKYRVEAAASRVCANNQAQCGDSYEGFYDGKGNYIVVLSDGMGTGLRAAIDSSLTATVTSRLLRAGLSCESALRMVNSTLLLRSTDESLATLDIVKINLYSGKAYFYKAGASISLVKKKSKLYDVELASMPLGILHEVNFSKLNLNLSDEDIILMASDGAFEYAEEKIKSVFVQTLDDSVRDVTERVLTQAGASRKGKPEDDITVISVRLRENV